MTPRIFSVFLVTGLRRLQLRWYLHSEWTRSKLLPVAKSSEIPMDFLALTSDLPDGPHCQGLGFRVEGLGSGFRGQAQ